MTRAHKAAAGKGAAVFSMVALLLQTASAETFQIRVLNSKNGERVAGQRVSVLVKGTKGATEYKTDAEGNISVDLAPTEKVFVATEWWVTCRKTGSGVDPFVPVAMILQEGVTIGNTCGSAKSETIKGKLIIFARKASPIELFRK